MLTSKKLFEGENESEIKNKILSFNERDLDLSNIDVLFHPLLKKYFKIITYNFE
jgi:hypothetical protein